MILGDLELSITLFAIVLLTIPVVNLILLIIYKNEYKGYVLKIIQVSIFFLSPLLIFVMKGLAFKVFICNIIALLMLIFLEKIYNDLLNTILVALVSQLTDSTVITSVFVSRSSVYALISRGYVIVNYKLGDYKIYDDMNKVSEKERKIFVKISNQKQKAKVKNKENKIQRE